MPLAKLQEHLRTVTERLDEITLVLLSEGPAGRATLMAERRMLLADVAKTCRKLDPPSMRSWLRSSLRAPQHMRLIK